MTATITPVLSDNKVIGAGYFALPLIGSLGATPATGTVAYTYGSWVQIILSTSAAIYITGIQVNIGNWTPDRYFFQIGTGAAASEVVVSEIPIQSDSASGTQKVIQVNFPFVIPVPTGTRIAVRAANNTTTNYVPSVSLIAINQANVVMLP